MSTIYNAQPALSRPINFFKGMLCDLWASRELAWRLFLRDLKANYRQSFLGYFWVFFPPLAMTASFLLMQHSNLLVVGELPVPYALYALSGMIFWQTFCDAVNAPMRIVAASKSMLVKLKFPRESLILTGMLQTAFTFTVRMVIFCAALFIFGAFQPTWSLLLAPVAFLGILLTGTMIGVILTPMSVLFEDFSQGMPLFLSFWLICTPVAYATHGNTLLAAFNSYNPLTYLIAFARGTLLPMELNWEPFALLSLGSFAFLFAGWVLYRISIPHLISRIGS